MDDRSHHVRSELGCAIEEVRPELEFMTGVVMHDRSRDV
jgi:hypothetical protein